MISSYLKTFKGLGKPVWLLSLVMLINRSGTMVIPFLAIYLNKELGFSMSRTGIIMAVFGIGSVTGNYIGGKLTDKIGFFPVQFWSLVLTGFAFISIQFFHGFLGLSAIIFLSSTISDSFRPANMTALSEYTTEDERTRSVSLLRLAANIGWGLGPAIAGFLIVVQGYNALFWIDGLTSIFGAVILWLFLKPKSQKYIREIVEEENLGGKPHKDYPFFAFVVLNGLTMIVFFQFFSTLPLFLKEEIGMSETMIGWIMAFNAFTIAIIEMPIIFKFEKKYKHIDFVILGTVLISLSFFFYSITNNVLLAYFSMAFLTIGEIFQMPFANSITMSRATKKHMGQYLAMYGISFSLAFILAPIIGMGLAERYGFDALYQVMFVLGILTVVGHWALRKRMIQKN